MEGVGTVRYLKDRGEGKRIWLPAANLVLIRQIGFSSLPSLLARCSGFLFVRSTLLGSTFVTCLDTSGMDCISHLSEASSYIIRQFFWKTVEWPGYDPYSIY